LFSLIYIYVFSDIAYYNLIKENNIEVYFNIGADTAGSRVAGVSRTGNIIYTSDSDNACCLCSRED